MIAVWVLIEGVVATWALRWSSTKSDKAFFSIFVGDAFLKMTGLALAVWWLWAHQLPYTQPLLMLGGGYLLLSFAQIPFFIQVR